MSEQEDTRRRFYDECYTILVRYAEAHESQRVDFIHAFMNDQRPPTEWRFGGNLGFGGKFYDVHHRQYVANYPEDRTTERDRIIDKVNQLIEKLVPKT